MEYLQKDDLVKGKAYEVRARNFKVAIWSGNQFFGLREKFGNLFMEGEFHYDDGAPFGTVKPIKELT